MKYFLIFSFFNKLCSITNVPNRSNPYLLYHRILCISYSFDTSCTYLYFLYPSVQSIYMLYIDKIDLNIAINNKGIFNNIKNDKFFIINQHEARFSLMIIKNS